MFSVEIAPRACLLWFEDRESEVPSTRIRLALSSVGDIDWEITAATVGNKILWKAEVLSVIESFNTASLRYSGRRERPSTGLRVHLDKPTEIEMQTGWEPIAFASV